MRYIYLHGFLSSPKSHKANYFQRLFRQMEIELERPDLNKPDFTTMTLTRQIETIERRIRRQGEAVTLIGSSMGGNVAAIVAEREPLVERLILIAPAFGFPNRYQGNMSAEELRGWRESGSIRLFHPGVGRGGSEQELSWEIMRDGESYAELELERQIPALLFHGLYDDVVAHDLSLDYLRLNSQARLYTMQSDHSLLDRLEEIGELTRIWIESQTLSQRETLPAYSARSSIHGKGCFAQRSIFAGELIGEYSGEPSPVDGTYVLWVQESKEGEVGGEKWRGVDGKNELRFLNHSSKPNCEFRGVLLYALHDIAPGEELTFHYGEEWRDRD